MTMEGLFFLIEALLFIILFVIMHLYTMKLYALVEEWKPMPLPRVQQRLPLVKHHEKEKTNETALYKGLTEGEIRRKRDIATKRQSMIFKRGTIPAHTLALQNK